MSDFKRTPERQNLQLRAGFSKSGTKHNIRLVKHFLQLPHHIVIAPWVFFCTLLGIPSSQETIRSVRKSSRLSRRSEREEDKLSSTFEVEILSTVRWLSAAPRCAVPLETMSKLSVEIHVTGLWSDSAEINCRFSFQSGPIHPWTNVRSKRAHGPSSRRTLCLDSESELRTLLPVEIKKKRQAICTVNG